MSCRAITAAPLEIGAATGVGCRPLSGGLSAPVYATAILPTQQLLGTQAFDGHLSYNRPTEAVYLLINSNRYLLLSTFAANDDTLNFKLSL